MNRNGDKPKKRKRRWGRYSLRTFLVLLTGFGVWLGLLVHRVNKQKEAVQWVREHGGRVIYDFEMIADPFEIRPILEPHDPKPPRPEPPGPDWLRELIGVDYFADVVFVDLANCEVKDIGPLPDLVQLKLLDLGNTWITDLGQLWKLTQLQYLNLSFTQVIDVEPLRNLDQLTELDLRNTRVTDVRPLRELKRLQDLWLAHTPVSDLSPLVGIKEVNIILAHGQQVIVPEELKDQVVRGWGFGIH